MTDIRLHHPASFSRRVFRPLLVAIGWYRCYTFSEVRIGFDVATRRGAGTLRTFRSVPVFTTLWSPRLWLVFLVHHAGWGPRLVRFISGDVWGDLALGKSGSALEKAQRWSGVGR